MKNLNKKYLIPAVILVIALIVGGNYILKKDIPDNQENSNENSSGQEGANVPDNTDDSGNADSEENAGVNITDNSESEEVLAEVPLPSEDAPAQKNGTSFFFEGDLYTFITPNTLELSEAYVAPDKTAKTVRAYVPYEDNSYYVTRIGSNAFSKAFHMEELTIPDSITDVGYQAFDGTLWLEMQEGSMIIVGDSVLALYRGAEPDVQIPDGVKYIGGAFFRNSVIESVTIPDSVQKINDHAFSYSANLSAVQIPAGLSDIGFSAFTGTKWYQNLTDEFAVVGDGILLRYTGADEKVSVPDSVRVIAAGAFSENAVITEVTLPDTVTAIGDEAFAYCGNLTAAALPDTLTEIGNRVFLNCGALERSALPESLRSVGSFLFMGCTDLKEVTVPDELELYRDIPYLGLPDGMTIE